MKGAVLEKYHRPLKIAEVEIPDPALGEVTVEVKACGLCLTDVHIREGKIPTVKLPLIPGHETAGVVSRKGPNVKGVEIGDRVAVFVDVTCGVCSFCLGGETNRCTGLSRIGFERNGGMAEYVNVPAANLEKLSDKVSFEKASIIADAVACMYRALKNVGEVSLGSKVAILGVGGVGRQGIIIAKLLGAYVACMDRRPQSVAMAAEMGADLLIDSSKEDFVPKIMQGMGPLDVVVNTIGTRESLPMAMEACRRGGKVVVLGYVSPTLEVPSYDLVIREKRVLGSRGVTRNEFREVVELVNSGRLDPDIGEKIPMAQVNEAFAGLEAGKFFTRSVLVAPFDN